MGDYQSFEDSLEEDDYGIIISPDGKIKGIWIPKHLEDEDEIPATLSRLIYEYFGVDPNDESTRHTVH